MKRGGIILAILLLFSTASASSILQFNSNTNNLNPGQTGVITLSLTNDGSDTSENVRVVFKDLDAPLNSSSVCTACNTYSNSERRCTDYKSYCYTEIGDIYGSNGKDAIYKVTVPEDTPKGVYVAEFEIHYYSKNFTTHETEAHSLIKKVVIDIDSLTIKPDINIESIDTPSNLSPGDEFIANITLKNTGEETAKEIILELTNSEFRVKGETNKILIQDLTAGKRTTKSVTLITDASLNPGLKTLSFNTSFTSDDTSYSKTCETGVMVDGETTFNVFIQDISPEVIKENSVINALISIANTGIINAEAVSIELESNTVQLGNVKEDYLGNLDTSDFTSTSFEFKPIKEGEAILNVTLTYLTPSGEKATYQSNERIIIRFSEEETTRQEFNYWWLIIIIIAGVSYYFYKKRK